MNHHAFAALKIAPYRTLLASSTVTFIAMQAEIMARGYLAYTITDSAIAVGVVQFSSGIPTAVLTLFGGAVADRIDKRTILLALQLLSCSSAFAVAVLTATEQLQIWHLAGAGVAQGIVFAFQIPARQSFVPQLVGKARLANAIALYAVGNNLSRVVGPGIAGTLIGAAWFGRANTYFLIAGFYTLALALIWLLPASAGEIKRNQESLLASITTGLRYIGGNRVLLLLMVMSVVPLAIGLPYQALLPVFSDRSLSVGPEGLGQLYAANGTGALIGSLLVASLKNIERRRGTQLALGAVFGLALAILGLSHDFHPALALLFFVGFCVQSFLTLNNTLVITNSPPELYGRVMSIYFLTYTIPPLAVFPVSALSDGIGIAPTFTLTGSLIALFFLALAVWNPVPRGRPAAET